MRCRVSQHPLTSVLLGLVATCIIATSYKPSSGHPVWSAWGLTDGKTAKEEGLGYTPLECWSTGDYLKASAIRRVYKNAWQRNHFFSGLTQSKYQANGSSLQQYCVSFKSVNFEPPVQTTLPVAPPNLCGLSTLVQLLRNGSDAGEWVGELHPTFQFKPHDYGACLAMLKAGTLDRRMLFAILKGERIVVSGDSMMRQMYLRLIQTIRNDRPEKEDEFEYSEHYYHQNSYYAASTTKDVFLIQKDMPANSTIDLYFPNKADIHFELIFVWDPVPETYSRTPFRLQPTTIIAGFFYWWNSPVHKIDPYLTVLDEFLVDNPGIQYFHMLTSWVKTVRADAVVSDSLRRERNLYLTERLATFSNAHTLDYAAFADIRHFPKTSDRLHYGCIYRKEYPAVLTLSESMIMKTGCTDPINRQWVVMLLSALAASKYEGTA
eukprot:Rhum_TRINITY_DN15244_c2_g1::Rhum_TRINITY_DN15244_c2_g1_i1::g.143564::m.143564